MRQASPPIANDEMWAILSPGSRANSGNSFLPPASKAGLRQQQYNNLRSRSLPPGLPKPAGSLAQPRGEPAVGFEESGREEDRQVLMHHDTELKHILNLEERLERGAQEVLQLRIRNEYACRETAALKSHLQHVQQQIFELQTRDASREQDSRYLAALRQTLDMQQQQQLSTLLASDDAKEQIAQQGRNSIMMLRGLVQQLQSSLSTEKVTIDQVRDCSQRCLLVLIALLW
jgi:hypothetical protein